MTVPQGPNLGDRHKDYFQPKHSPEALRQEEARLLALLQLGHQLAWPAEGTRRVVEHLLRITWIRELAEAEAAGDHLRVSVLELEIRDIYRQLQRRRAA